MNEPNNVIQDTLDILILNILPPEPRHWPGSGRWSEQLTQNRLPAQG
jgi:hypothetical protein